MGDDPKRGADQPTEDQQEKGSQQEPKDTRREFLTSLNKWSKVVIGLAVFGSAVLKGDAQAKEEKWHNGGGWNNGGWKNGGWKNGGWNDGGWKNHRRRRWHDYPGWGDYPGWIDFDDSDD